jgi:hypothetical protein
MKKRLTSDDNNAADKDNNESHDNLEKTVGSNENKGCPCSYRRFQWYGNE